MQPFLHPRLGSPFQPPRITAGEAGPERISPPKPPPPLRGTADELAWRSGPESSPFEKGGLRGIFPNDPFQNPSSPPPSTQLRACFFKGRNLSPRRKSTVPGLECGGGTARSQPPTVDLTVGFRARSQRSEETEDLLRDPLLLHVYAHHVIALGQDHRGA